jgi:hypothetical protein
VTDPTDDELRARLRGIDPMPASVPIEPVSGDAARELMERIMQTQPSPTTTTDTTRNVWWRGPIAAVAAVAAVAVLGVGGIVAFNTGGSDPSVLALDGGGATDPTAMCMQIDAETLRMFPIAFAGTAIEMEDGVATLEVTEWFRGGDADRVTIEAPPAQPALIGGVDIEVGGDYLITADNNTVSSCNFSDVASPELEALYREAFGG